MSKRKKTIEPPEPPKVALLCMSSMPGVSTVMRNMMAVMPDHCQFFPLENRDIKDLPDQFHSSPLVVLGGWDPEYYQILCKRRNGVSVLLCSSMGQVDLSGVEMKFIEQIYTLKLNHHIDKVVVGSIELFVALRRYMPSLIHMPYPVDLEEFQKFQYKEKVLNFVGMFLPTHPRKNILNQAYGVYEAHEILKTSNQAGIEVKTNFPMNLGDMSITNLGWKPRKDYLKTVKDMKMGMHVTYTESFGYAALDYLLSGVPVLVSTTVALNLKIAEDFEWKDLVIINPDSIREIANSVVSIMALDEEDYKQLSSMCWSHARNMSRRLNVEFARFMKTFAESSEENTAKK